MIKFIITGLDRVFLNSSGSFDKEYYRRVKKIMDDQHIVFAVCTEKQCERVEEILSLKDSRNIWILGDSATRIKYNGKYIYELLLPNSLGLEIIDKIEAISLDHIIIAFTSTAAFIKSPVDEAVVRKMYNSYDVIKTLDDLHDIKEDFVKIKIFDPKLRCFDSVKQLSAFKDKAYIVAPEAAQIDILNCNVYKGTTVQQLQKMLSITKDETMAFGAGLNDIELMDAATYSFAVANAFGQTRKRAAFIVKSNDENGVLQTIEKILALQK